MPKSFDRILYNRKSVSNRRILQSGKVFFYWTLLCNRLYFLLSFRIYTDSGFSCETFFYFYSCNSFGDFVVEIDSETSKKNVYPVVVPVKYACVAYWLTRHSSSILKLEVKIKHFTQKFHREFPKFTRGLISFYKHVTSGENAIFIYPPTNTDTHARFYL